MLFPSVFTHFCRDLPVSIARPACKPLPKPAGTCRCSRRCTSLGAADGRLVVEATMRAFVVVIVGPRLEAGIALVGIGPVFCVGPFAQRGLDKALGFAVGSWRVGPGAAVVELHLQASQTKLSRSITGAIVGEQCADADAVAGEELHRGAQKIASGIGLLIGQQR